MNEKKWLSTWIIYNKTRYTTQSYLLSSYNCLLIVKLVILFHFWSEILTKKTRNQLLNDDKKSEYFILIRLQLQNLFIEKIVHALMRKIIDFP